MQMEAASKGLRRRLCDTLTPPPGPVLFIGSVQV